MEKVRPKRERRAPQQFDASENHSKIWTVRDKRKLLGALKKYGKTDINNIVKELAPRKNRAQVEKYLRSLKFRSSRFLPGVDYNLEAPIETWLSLSEELMRDQEDYSNILSKVMATLGSLEPHLTCKSNKEVDYTAVYQYLAALMRGDLELPYLKDLNAAIVLDLLQCMADALEQMDLSPQKQLVVAKYRLLRSKVSLEETAQQRYENTRKAFQNEIEVTSGLSELQTEIMYPHQLGRKLPHLAASSQSENTTQSSDQPGPSSQGPPAATVSPAAAGLPRPRGPTRPVQPGPTTGPQQVQIRLPAGFKLPPGQYKFTPEQLQHLISSQTGNTNFILPGMKPPTPGTPGNTSVHSTSSTLASTPGARPQTPSASKPSPSAPSASTTSASAPSASTPSASTTTASKSSANTTQSTNKKPTSTYPPAASRFNRAKPDIIDLTEEPTPMEVDPPSTGPSSSSTPSTTSEQSGKLTPRSQQAQTPTGQSNSNPPGNTSAPGSSSMPPPPTAPAQPGANIEGFAGLDNVVETAEGSPNAKGARNPSLLKRTTMYSLNPFCIPIRFLNPRPK